MVDDILAVLVVVALQVVTFASVMVVSWLRSQSQ
jgi:hypothetical protein